MSDIGITMLGASGSGKTCYMLAMYAAMSIGIRGFTFTTQDPDDDLELGNHWERLETKGEWPDATTQSKDWLFDCSYGFKKIKGFRWHDYRGGALLDSSKPVDREELLKKFKASSCVILCISGETLVKFVQGQSGLPREVRQFNSLMTDFVKTTGKTVPVVIAVTKADLCNGKILSEGVNAIKDKMLPTLFAPNSGWLVMISPVSLGEEKSGGFEIRPLNVHLPVTFAILNALRTDMENTQQAISSKQHEMVEKNFEVQHLGRNWLAGLWNNSEIASGQNAIASLQRDTKSREMELQTLQRNLDLLKNELLGDELYMFFGGRRITI